MEQEVNPWNSVCLVLALKNHFLWNPRMLTHSADKASVPEIERASYHFLLNHPLCCSVFERWGFSGAFLRENRWQWLGADINGTSSSTSPWEPSKPAGCSSAREHEATTR